MGDLHLAPNSITSAGYRTRIRKRTSGARVNIDLSLRYDQRTTFVSILSPSLLLLITLLSLLLSRFTGTPGEPSSPSIRTRAGRLAYSVDLHADLIRVHAHSARPSPLKRGLGRGRGRRRWRGRRSVESLLPLSVSFREDYYRRKLEEESKEDPLDTVNRNCYEENPRISEIRDFPRSTRFFRTFPRSLPLPRTLSSVI